MSTTEQAVIEAAKCLVRHWADTYPGTEWMRREHRALLEAVTRLGENIAAPTIHDATRGDLEKP